MAPHQIRMFRPVSVLVVALALGSCGGSDSASPTTPGSDLSIVARFEPESDADPAQLDAAAAIVADRLQALDVADARVDAIDDRLEVRAPEPIDPALLDLVVRRFRLELRLVVAGPFPDECPDGTGSPYRNEQGMCWSLGPALLDDPNIARAEANLEPGGGGWYVIVEFGDDRFVSEVAEPYVNSSVAIVVDDVVVSAPTINPGITGREIQITGEFTESEARALAAALGRDPLEVDLDAVPVAASES